MRKAKKKVNVILKSFVRNLGGLGSVVNVKKGYFRYLSKQGIAVMYSEAQNTLIQSQLNHKDYVQEKKNAHDIFEKIHQKSFIFTRQASGTDILYASVTNKDIVLKVHDVINVNVDRRKIIINQPIKKIGIYIVFIDLFDNLCAELQILVARTESDAKELLKKSMETTVSHTEINMDKKNKLQNKSIPINQNKVEHQLDDLNSDANILTKEINE